MSILNPTVSVAPVDTASAGVTQDTANVNRTDQGTIPNQVDQPDTGVASVQRPRSNTPDADTKAGASMPPALINDPAVPSQKLAVQADLNKTSPAPHHSWVYSAAQALAGGPEYGVRYDTDGTPVKYEKRVSPAHIGMAIALEVLRGGLAGASEHGPGAEGRAGQKAMDQETKIREQRAKQVQDEMAQGTAAQQNKLNLFEANMKNYQTAGIVAQQSKEIAQVYPDSLKALTEPILDGSMPLPEGSTMDKMFETDAAAGVKNKTISATGDLLLPYGDAQPVIDPATHQQKVTNGQPEWGHMYLVVHNAANWRARLTKDMQDKLHEIGMFQQNGTDAKIGTPDWSMADLAAKYATYTQIKAGETLLQSHKDDAHKVLGRESENLDSLAEEVRKDPQMRKAMQLFVQAQTGVNKDANGGKIDHVPQIDEVLSRMSTIDPTATNKLMGYLKLDSKDLLDMQLKRTEEAAEAKNVKLNAPEADAQKRLDILTKDPIDDEKHAIMVVSATKPVNVDAATWTARQANAQKFLDNELNESARKAERDETAKQRAQSDVGEIPQLAKDIIGGDISKIADSTSYRGGQRIALLNALHDEAVRQGKDPNEWGAAALKTRADMYEDYRSQKNGTTGSNITAFDAFLGHADDAMDANDKWRRTGSPLINRPLKWLETNAYGDTNFIQFTTALEPVRKEFMSFLNANRAEHEPDIKVMQTVLSDTSTPAMIEVALKQLGKSADIRLAAIGRKYINTFHVPFPNLVSDDGKKALQHMGIATKTEVSNPTRTPVYVNGKIVGYK